MNLSCLRCIKQHKGWKIYRLEEAYLMHPAEQWIDLLIAHKLRHDPITGVDLPDLIADIDEAER